MGDSIGIFEYMAHIIGKDIRRSSDVDGNINECAVGVVYDDKWIMLPNKERASTFLQIAKEGGEKRKMAILVPHKFN